MSFASFNAKEDCLFDVCQRFLARPSLRDTAGQRGTFHGVVTRFVLFNGNEKAHVMPR